MSLWMRFRRLPRLGRMAVALIVGFPLILAVAGDWGDALRTWAIIAAAVLIPTIMVQRMIPRADGVDAEDPRHPRHRQASLVTLALTLAVAIAVAALFGLLG